MAHAVVRYVMAGSRFVMPFGTNGMLLMLKPPHREEIISFCSKREYKVMKLIKHKPTRLYWCSGCALGYALDPDYRGRRHETIESGFPRNVYKHRTYISRALWFSPRLRNVKIIYSYAVDTVREYDSEDTMFFIDCPSWPHFHRREEMLELLCKLKGMAFVAGGGWGERYRVLTEHGYKRVSLKVGKRSHSNYHEKSFYYKGPKDDYDSGF